jgi:ABC-type transporter Mla MlaB component
LFLNHFRPVPALHRVSVVLRSDRAIEGEFVVMTLSGHLAVEELDDLRRLMNAESVRRLVLDLSDVTLVDREAVALLTSFEAAGVQLRHCPAYVTAWMAAERNQHTDR